MHARYALVGFMSSFIICITGGSSRRFFFFLGGGERFGKGTQARVPQKLKTPRISDTFLGGIQINF